LFSGFLQAQAGHHEVVFHSFMKARGTSPQKGGYCHGLRGSGLARLRARRHVTQIFRFRLVLLGAPPPSSDP